MLRIVLLVLADLWQFVQGRADTQSEYALQIPATSAVSSQTSADREPSTLQIAQNHDVLLIPSAPVKPFLAATQPFTQIAEHASTVDVAVSDYSVPVLSQDPFTIGVAYVAGEETLLQVVPHQDFDSVIQKLSYGQPVLVKSYTGRYVEVRVGDKTGYIEKDCLVHDRKIIWPEFVAGAVYTVDHDATISTRRLLSDEFAGGTCGLALQAGEFVTVRLLQDQITIPWTLERPRMPGSWHQLLRGLRSVRIGVQPLTDSVMEWTAEDGDGRLAYVEQVLPDQTIQIAGVGIAVAGEYTQITLPPPLWREWRPVFMTFN